MLTPTALLYHDGGQTHKEREEHDRLGRLGGGLVLPSRKHLP